MRAPLDKPNLPPGSAPLLPKHLFRGLPGIVHLAAGGETPPLLSHLDAAERFLADKAGGMPGRHRFGETLARVREKAARLAGLSAGEIAFTANASEGMSLAASRLELGAGDNVVVALSEFPSVLLSVQVLAERGVEVRLVGTGIVPQHKDYAAAVDDRTQAIVVSHVSHLTGTRLDLAALRFLADSCGARLLVDASHSLGVVPVEGRLCDVVVSCCYKWLLGVHGCAVFGVNEERWPELQPRVLGWNAVQDGDDWRARADYRVRSDIARFEAGNPSFLSLYLLENGLDHLIEVGQGPIAAHVEALASQLCAGLDALGLSPVTPLEGERRAGNVSILHDAPAELERRLRERGVLVWAGEGRLRFSVHLYNEIDDVERCLATLADLR
jgi:selenocysteine lyase/cysteine desulfurase